MLTRRHLLMLAGATAVLATVLPQTQFVTRAFAQDAGAITFVQTNGNRIISVARAAQTDPSARSQLLDAVNQTLDVDGIARFALGPYARRATQAQLAAYLDVFHQVISNGVTARLAAYQDATFTVGGSKPDANGTIVDTTITRPGSPAANVSWLVGSIDGATRILDVIAEGTSLRLTERSDYTSYLQSHDGDMDQLIAALKAQVAG